MGYNLFIFCIYPGSLCGVLAGVLPSSSLVASEIGLVETGNLRHERVIRIGVCEEGADGEEDLADGERRRPRILQDVQADPALFVHVWVVDGSHEADFGRFEGVVGGEVDVEDEDAAGVGAVTRAEDDGLPVEH